LAEAAPPCATAEEAAASVEQHLWLLVGAALERCVPSQATVTAELGARGGQRAHAGAAIPADGCVSAASQLEAAGHWHVAVFVLLHSAGLVAVDGGAGGGGGGGGGEEGEGEMAATSASIAAAAAAAASLDRSPEGVPQRLVDDARHMILRAVPPVTELGGGTAFWGPFLDGGNNDGRDDSAGGVAGDDDGGGLGAATSFAARVAFVSRTCRVPPLWVAHALALRAVSDGHVCPLGARALRRLAAAPAAHHARVLPSGVQAWARLAACGTVARG
jgi:hypothetical protein